VYIRRTGVLGLNTLVPVIYLYVIHEESLAEQNTSLMALLVVAISAILSAIPSMSHGWRCLDA